MSGTDACVIKLGNKEMEANDVREFCRAILEMRDSEGNRRSPEMAAYLRMSKEIEKTLRDGVPEDRAVNTAVDLLSQKQKTRYIDREMYTRAGELYMSRRRGKGNHIPMSNEVRSKKPTDFTEQREQSIMPHTEQHQSTRWSKSYHQIAKRNNWEIINFEMRIPREIFDRDYLSGVQGNTYGGQDLIVATVYVNNPDGSPQYTENDRGEMVRKTGIRTFSYDPHYGGQGSDATKLFDELVMANVQTEMVRKSQQDAVTEIPDFHSRLMNLCVEIAENSDGNAQFKEGNINENRIASIMVPGRGEDGKLKTVSPGINEFDLEYTMRVRKDAAQKAKKKQGPKRERQ